jgi:hypothetical protein
MILVNSIYLFSDTKKGLKGQLFFLSLSSVSPLETRMFDSYEDARGLEDLMVTYTLVSI